MKFNIRVWSIILKNSHIENKEKFCNIYTGVYETYIFFFWIQSHTEYVKKKNTLLIRKNMFLV